MLYRPRLPAATRNNFIRSAFRGTLSAMRPTLSMILAALLVFATTPGAYALTKEEKRELDKLVKKGTDAYKDGRLLEALDAFGQARKINDDPRVDYNYARVLETSGFCARAKAEFESLASLKNPDKAVRNAARKKAEGDLECKSAGIVTFTCSAPDTELTVNEMSAKCDEPMILPVAAAKWSATAPDHKPARGTFTPAEGEEQKVEVALEKEVVDEPPPPPVAETKFPEWLGLAGGLTAGAGVGFLVMGIVSDATATRRSEQILDAATDRDIERLERLENAASSARTRSLVLTIMGATLLAGGGVALYLHFGTGSEEKEARPIVIAPSISPDGATIDAHWSW